MGRSIRQSSLTESCRSPTITGQRSSFSRPRLVSARLTGLGPLDNQNRNPVHNRVAPPARRADQPYFFRMQITQACRAGQMAHESYVKLQLPRRFLIP